MPAKDKRAPESMARAVRAAGPPAKAENADLSLVRTARASSYLAGPGKQVLHNSPAAGQACRVAELLTPGVCSSTPGVARCGRPKALGHPAAPGGQPSLEASNGEWCEGGSAA